MPISGVFNGVGAFGDGPFADVDHFWLRNLMQFMQILLFLWRQKAQNMLQLLGDFRPPDPRPCPLS